jgi:AraC-like DNA-binding protein
VLVSSLAFLGVMVMLVVDQWLRERPPAPDLLDKLRCVWRGDLGAMCIPVPDECYDIVWVNDGSLWLSGPETTSWSRGYPLGSSAVGVRFRPGVGPAVVGIAGWEVRDARIRLGELWPDRDVRELAGRVGEQPDDAGRIRVIEDTVRCHAAIARPVDAAAAAVAAEVGRVRPTPVRDLARAMGVSERQIHRRCSCAFGYGPAVLTRMLRLHRALRLARSDRRPARLADLAVASGYFDQQHLAHEVRAIFGTTASALFSAVTSDPYKTRRLAGPDDGAMRSLRRSDRREQDRATTGEIWPDIGSGPVPAAREAS